MAIGGEERRVPFAHSRNALGQRQDLIIRLAAITWIVTKYAISDGGRNGGPTR